MKLYQQECPKGASWPAPLEGLYQQLSKGEASRLAPKLPHLRLSEILFMTLVMCLPPGQRPWGIVTWMAGAFLLSRPALYALTKRTQEKLLEPEVCVVSELTTRSVVISRERVVRTVLTAAFPGKMALRPMQAVLGEAFAERGLAE